MALSAWVKWRIVAGALLLGVMFFGAGFAGAINARAANRVGPLFQYCSADGHRVEFVISASTTGIRFRSPKRGCACFSIARPVLGLLLRKVRAYEVIRMNDRILFEDVSKFYGEILGVNRVNLSIPPGITSLVGPNGSGKTTLMNLMTGLVRPSRGRIEVLGLSNGRFRKIYSRFWDTARSSMRFPRG